jgi:membrane protein implicated in regulation of membrane protease activity
MMKHIWVGFSLVALALAIGGWLWLRNVTTRPFSPPQSEQAADPETAAVMERVRQEQAEAQAEDAARLPAEPQTEDLE